MTSESIDDDSDFRDWIARLSGLVEGYLMVEHVTCHMHGPEPVDEVEWTACIFRDGGKEWTRDIREDPHAALDEIADGICPWTDPPSRLDWLSPEEAKRIAEAVFWPPWTKGE